MSGTFRHEYGKFKKRPVTDTTPPSIPTGLVVNNPTDKTLNLSWNPSTDVGGVGVAGYVVWVYNPVSFLFERLANSDVPSYVATGLTYSTSYTYRISAFDGRGNESGLSLAASGSTTADVTSPSVPTALSAFNPQANSIQLSWNASSDPLGSGVVGYRLYRSLDQQAGYTLIQSPVGTSATVGGLTPSTTYWFKVAAIDAAGNISAQSSPATETTLGQEVLEWNIPDVPGVDYTFPNTFFPGDVISVLPLVNVPEGVTPYLQVMSAVDGDGNPVSIQIEPTTGEMIAPILPEGSTSDSFDITISLDTPPTTAESSWLSRSTASGVQWAHDFDEEWEALYFRLDNDGQQPTTIDVTSNPSYHGDTGYMGFQQKGNLMYWQPTADGLPYGGCAEFVNRPETSITASYLPATITDLQEFQLDIVALPDRQLPAVNLANGKKWLVLLANADFSVVECMEVRAIANNVPSQPATLTVRRELNFASRLTTPKEWPAGSTLYWPVHPAIFWKRPFSPLKYVDGPPAGTEDIGLKVVPAIPETNKPLYSPTAANGGERSAAWRFGYYSHPDYSDVIADTVPAPLADTVLPFSPHSSHPTWPRKDGEEFYIQFRAKYSGFRDVAWNFTSAKKFWWILDQGNSSPGQGEIVVTMARDGFLNYYQHDASGFAPGSWAYPPQSRVTYNPAFPSQIEQYGYNGNTCTYPTEVDTRGNRCWLWPKDTWVTFMWRIKVGRKAGRRNYATLTAAVAAEAGPTNIFVSDMSLLPRIIPGNTLGVHRNSYHLTLNDGTVGGTEIVNVIAEDVALKRLTVERSDDGNNNTAPKAFVAGSLVQMVGGQQNEAWPFSYTSDTRMTLYAHRHGIDPPGEYVTVLDNPYMCLTGPADALYGWNNFMFHTYNNGEPSFAPWKYQLAQVIFSKNFIPAPQI